MGKKTPTVPFPGEQKYTLTPEEDPELTRLLDNGYWLKNTALGEGISPPASMYFDSDAVRLYVDQQMEKDLSAEFEIWRVVEITPDHWIITRGHEYDSKPLKYMIHEVQNNFVYQEVPVVITFNNDNTIRNVKLYNTGEQAQRAIKNNHNYKREYYTALLRRIKG
jgi:hypothetical protein